ncbi:PAS domain S-box protein [Pseudomonas sp. GX19020]|uniref:sensor histidine kinase n=1 Tax=Pseudomonas sp. GX19020 TaxID=2942277 RepID=UPI0020195282|nr:PAS domain S-box protein [Pseudomonas sp. GX19020]MCL4069452.1 PAS domain S-box protein [Pseudomonas sp. GX19020]
MISDSVAPDEIDLARLAAIVTSSSDAIISKNLSGTITSWNSAASRIFGFDADEAIGASIMMIIPPDREAEEMDILSRIRRGDRVEPYDTVRLSKCGKMIDISLTVSPLKSRSGEVVGASKIARDISDRKRSEEVQAILVNELNHRTKNLLATIQSIAARTFGEIPGNESRLNTFRSRITALSASQDLLTSRGGRGASLKDMAAAVIRPFDHAGNRIIIENSFDCELTMRQTSVLSMAIHELATNALKYGALSVPEGQVRMDWKRGAGTIQIVWQEFDGPTVVVPRRTGFGTQMITSALRHELGASVDLKYLKEGVLCTIGFPT